MSLFTTYDNIWQGSSEVGNTLPPVSLSNLLDFRHKDSFDAINFILDNPYVWCLNDTILAELKPNGKPYTQL